MGLQGPMLASSSCGYNGKKLLGLILLSFDDDYCYYYTSWSGHMFSSLKAWSTRGAQELTQTIKTEREWGTKSSERDMSEHWKGTY